MVINEYNVKGVKLTIIQKPAFEMVGYKRPANLGDGSIGAFIQQLNKDGNISKLERTLASPQQIWVCLSDCQSCGLNCSGFQVCTRVCVEKTENHNFSEFADDELSSLHLAASEWVLYETNDKQATDDLHEVGVYEFVKQIGYKWNESIRLHFDNGHEIDHDGEWIFDKPYHFLLPVVSL